MSKAAITLVTLFVILACASTAIEDPAIRRATAGVELVEAKPTRDFDLLKEVTGISCARQVGSSPSI